MPTTWCFDSVSLAALGSGASPGTVNAANGLTLDFGGNITGFGTVSTPNILAKPLINNGHITGTSAAQRITLPGYVKGVGTFDNVSFTGTFSPGLSPTILTVGNIALSPTSTLMMELGGTAAGSGYDQIQSSGALTFDGTLQLSIINGFTPSAGQSFNLFDWLSTSGTFDTLDLPTLAGLAWNTSQLYTDGVLSLVTSAGLPGDYNQDGTRQRRRLHRLAQQPRQRHRAPQRRHRRRRPGRLHPLEDPLRRIERQRLRCHWLRQCFGHRPGANKHRFRIRFAAQWIVDSTVVFGHSRKAVIT